MLTIEVVGAPGAGKSTLVPGVMEACRRAGRRPLLMDVVVPEAMGRTLAGRLVGALVPASWRPKVLWRLFRAYRLVHALLLFVGRPALLRHLLVSQRGRSDQSDRRSRRVLYWYVRHCGGWRLLSRCLDRDEVLVVDEGFIHRVVQLHTSAVERLSPRVARSYCSLVPVPDLVVHVVADPATCHQRVLTRGVWERWSHRSPEEIEQYVAHAHEAIELAVSEVELQGGAVLRVDNGTSEPTSAIEGLTQRLTGELGVSGPTSAPGRSAPLALPRWLVPRLGTVRDRVRARVHAPGVEGDELQAVLDRYDLTRRGRPRNVGVGWRNPLVVVATDRGGFVVKRYPERFDRCALDHEHSILAQLADVDFPAVRLEPALDGSTVTRVGQAHYGVFRFEPGRSLAGCRLPIELRRDAIRQAGQLLAQFHTVLAGFRPIGAHHLGIDPVTGRPRRDLDWHQRRLAVLRGDGNFSQPALVRVSERASERLAELDALLAAADLPVMIIHGDFGLHNVLVSPEGGLVLHDFELARRERRLVDIVTSGRRYSDRELGWFLAGYSEVSRLTPDEWACIDLVAEEYWLCGAVQSWSNFRSHGGPERLRTATRRFERADAVGRGGWHDA